MIIALTALIFYFQETSFTLFSSNPPPLPPTHKLHCCLPSNEVVHGDGSSPCGLVSSCCLLLLSGCGSDIPHPPDSSPDSSPDDASSSDSATHPGSRGGPRCSLLVSVDHSGLYGPSQPNGPLLRAECNAPGGRLPAGSALVDAWGQGLGSDPLEHS